MRDFAHAFHINGVTGLDDLGNGNARNACTAFNGFPEYHFRRLACVHRNPPRKALDLAYRLLFRQHLTVPDAVARIRATLPALPEIEHLARFAETSGRGLTR